MLQPPFFEAFLGQWLYVASGSPGYRGIELRALDIFVERLEHAGEFLA